MTRGSNFANKNGHIDYATAFKLLSQRHPKVCSVIEQVRKSSQIGAADKRMIQEQLVAMCITLNCAEKYALHMGEWENGNAYSGKRAQLVQERRTIRNETVFTIVSGGKRKHWDVYVDLPIKVTV